MYKLKWYNLNQYFIPLNIFSSGWPILIPMKISFWGANLLAHCKIGRSLAIEPFQGWAKPPNFKEIKVCYTHFVIPNFRICA